MINNEEFAKKYNIPIEDISAALEEAKKEKETNYLILNFSYKRYILPFKKGIQLLKACEQAEVLERIDYNFNKIVPVDSKSEITCKILSYEEYVELKMRNILKITEKPDNE